MSDSNAKAAQFIRNEEDVRLSWLSMLIYNPHAPLDVAYKAKLMSIEREYYPYAMYYMTCAAGWAATSIWEHQEDRQKPVTKYRDYQGNLYDSNGTDARVVGEKTYYLSRTVETIYETETVTVTDKIEQTSGQVGPIKLKRNVWLGPGGSKQAFLNWAEAFPENQFVPLGAVSNNAKIIPETKPQSTAQNEAAQAAVKNLTKKAKSEVPGNRYENFRITGSDMQNVVRKLSYVPVFHVSYTYEGQFFECFMTGSTRNTDMLVERQPIDMAIKGQYEALDRDIKKNNGCRQVASLVISWILGLLGLSALLPLAVDDITRFFSYGHDFGLLVFGLVMLAVSVACIGFGVWNLVRFFAKRKNHREAKSAKGKIETDSTAIKEQILALASNEAIPEERKARMIQQMIADFEASNLSGNRQ